MNDYHGYHFRCQICKKELDETARVVNEKDLFCSRCYDETNSVCGACRRPIDNERSVKAVGKWWHLDHFSCFVCGKPFYGSKYIERRDKAYCERCYVKTFAEICYKCSTGLIGGNIKVFKKHWCPKCYTCCTCDAQLDVKSKVVEFDMRPLCKKCYEKLPDELKERLMKTHEKNDKHDKGVSKSATKVFGSFFH
ncbi:hypothetical protein AB6A40_007855 [Gnathostoma spinigerum]|uniref:LIM zinc-binding domain-containing protein n=1 Tax=Gnathostoma spinigerum TaxID=75299 RepID=A0ABD6EUM2_9BILA